MQNKNFRRDGERFNHVFRLSEDLGRKMYAQIKINREQYKRITI